MQNCRCSSLRICNCSCSHTWQWQKKGSTQFLQVEWQIFLLVFCNINKSMHQASKLAFNVLVKHIVFLIRTLADGTVVKSREKWSISHFFEQHYFFILNFFILLLKNNLLIDQMWYFASSLTNQRAEGQKSRYLTFFFI